MEKVQIKLITLAQDYHRKSMVKKNRIENFRKVKYMIANFDPAFENEIKLYLSDSFDEETIEKLINELKDVSILKKLTIEQLAIKDTIKAYEKYIKDFEELIDNKIIQNEANLNKEIDTNSLISMLQNSKPVNNLGLVDELMKEAKIDIKEQNEILYDIASYNLKQYIKLANKSNESTFFNEDTFLNILNLNKEDKETLKKFGNISNIKVVADILGNNIDLSRFSSEKLTQILLGCSADNLNQLFKLFEEKQINKEILYNNPEILVSGCNEIINPEGEIYTPKMISVQNNFIENLNIFSKTGIDINIFLEENRSIFFENPKNNIRNIMILREYNLPFTQYTLKLVTEKPENLRRKLDYLIENKEFKRNNISIEDINKIKEIIINPSIPKMALIPYYQDIKENEEIILSITKNNRVEKILKALDERLNGTNLTYDINGLIISKNKVKYNLYKLQDYASEKNALISSIVYNTNLNGEQYAMIVSLVDDILLKGKVMVKKEKL